MAVRDTDYMAERVRVQISAMFATAAVAMVLASRYGIDALITGLVVLIGGAVTLPLINRLSGWVVTR